MTGEEPAVICGAMPKGTRWYHTSAFGFMCLMFLVMGGIGVRVLFAAANGPMTVAAGMCMTISAGLALQIRELRRLVREYRYDGLQLRCRTLGSQTEQGWRLSEFKGLREFKGRSSGLGYRVELRDGRVVYLYSTVSNLSALVMALRADLARGF
ncbi:MAG TPA: hypothetical protein VKU01_35005 [Bryobacteraceae bacterium]|nr:hypothetical protein [Bryobacteraceae bacterium]